MSIIEDVGGQVRAATEEFPVALLGQALEKFGLAAERLRWVRQESANPMGVPELSAATEHAESAGYALRVAQEQLSAYLTAIGLGADGTPAPRPEQRAPRHDTPPASGPATVAPEPAEQVRMRRWWSVRVAELTGGREGTDDEPDERVDDSQELLRRVVGGVRSGDRDRLRKELRRAPADVGLGMAALAPPLLRELAGELLGHPPRATDLGRLRGELDGRVRDLLPGLPPPVLETLLTRVCRMPPPRASGEPPHAADSAVTAGVATGLLLARLGRDLPAGAREPAEAREPAGAGQRGDAGKPARAGQPAVAQQPGATGRPGAAPSAGGAVQRPGTTTQRSGGLPPRSDGPPPRPGGLPPRSGSPWRDAPTRRGSDG
ncbi:hypothetical protein GAR05_04193 [Micromonospora saelicesensis]|uniref:Translation initiation factor IF-2 n=1 Tax=Micromonospora saelicesensis TaxID=285676 RepID=A0ABX9CFC2_9ACTN|nr:hypothetical protein [Micromonospora saelicesensis]RAN95842.1 hypothetical protein GAR05_04193 [Micromonospora saelicesensis]